MSLKSFTVTAAFLTTCLSLGVACDVDNAAESVADELVEAEDEAEVEVIVDVAEVEVAAENATRQESDDLDLAGLASDPLAGYSSSAFNTSWHSTKVSVHNGAGMPSSKVVWFWGDAYHTNDTINFYWARVEHRVYDYSNTQYIGTVTCTYQGDWAKKYKLTCPAAAEGLSGWTIRTRLCADIKDDGKGTRCTPNAVTSAVW